MRTTHIKKYLAAPNEHVFKFIVYLFSKRNDVDVYIHFQFMILLCNICYLCFYDVQNNLVSVAADNAGSPAQHIMLTRPTYICKPLRQV